MSLFLGGQGYALRLGDIQFLFQFLQSRHEAGLPLFRTFVVKLQEQIVGFPLTIRAFNLTDDVIAGAAISWSIFLQTFALGWLYVTVYFAVGAFIFSGREL